MTSFWQVTDINKKPNYGVPKTQLVSYRSVLILFLFNSLNHSNSPNCGSRRRPRPRASVAVLFLCSSDMLVFFNYLQFFYLKYVKLDFRVDNEILKFEIMYILKLNLLFFLDLACPICSLANVDLTHLIFQCVFSNSLLSQVNQWPGIVSVPVDSQIWKIGFKILIIVYLVE